MSYKLKWGKWLLVALLSVLFTGCTSMQTISNYARTGDTVMVSLGGSTKNSLVPVLKKENMTAVITDSAGTEQTISIRNLFKLHADQTSLYNYFNQNHKLSGQTGYVDAYQGQWMAVIDLVDPVTQEAVNIVPGQASIAITSTELDGDFQYYNTEYNGNLGQVSIEVIDGVGSTNPLNYMTPISESPMDYLEPLSQILISPQGNYDSDNVTIGGLEYVISYTPQDFYIYKPNVAKQIVDGKSQLAVKYLPQGDGTTHIKIMLMNPNGFIEKLTASGAQRYMEEASPISALVVSLYWPTVAQNQALDDTTWMNSLQLISSAYVDTNGNPIPELTANLQKVR